VFSEQSPIARNSHFLAFVDKFAIHIQDADRILSVVFAKEMIVDPNSSLLGHRFSL
jgi:hypothetical protein